MKICFFIFANIADPDEMTHYKVFHLSLHFLPKCMVAEYQVEELKGLKHFRSSIRPFVCSFVRTSFRWFLPLVPSVTKYISVTTYQEAYIFSFPGGLAFTS